MFSGRRRPDDDGGRKRLNSPPKRANADDTFAKLMRVNAWVRGGRPAFRLKDFGVWRTWTWAEAYRGDARAGARASPISGCRKATASPSPAATGRGSIGRSPRRRCSAPSPCRSTPTPSPTKSLHVLEHAGATLIVAQDQEQVDKALSILDRLPRASARIFYDEPRGLADYDDPRLTSLDEVDGRRPRRARRPRASPKRSTRVIDAGRRLRTLGRSSTPPARPAARRAWC